MKQIKPWLRFNEKLLNFEYPTKIEGMTIGVVLKKVFVDNFIFDLVLAALLYAFLRPSTLEGYLFFFFLILMTAFVGIVLELLSILIAKRKRRLAEKNR